MSYANAILHNNYRYSYDEATKHLIEVYYNEKVQKKRNCIKINNTLTNIPLKRIFNKYDGIHCYDLLTLVTHFESEIQLQDVYTYPLSNDRVTFNDMKRIANNILEYNFYITKLINSKFKNENEKYKYAFEHEIVEFNESKIPFIPQPIHIKSKLLNLMFLDLMNKKTATSSIVKEILEFDFENINYNQTQFLPNQYLESLKNSYSSINTVSVDFALDFYKKHFPALIHPHLKNEIIILTYLIENKQIPIHLCESPVSL